MSAHKRYLKFRNERLENKNRWLTILAVAVLIVLLVAIMAGPAFIRVTGESTTESTDTAGAAETTL